MEPVATASGSSAVTADTDSDPSGSHSRLHRVAILAIVTASLGWTIYNWDGLSRIRDELGTVVVFAVLLVLTEICFIVGGVLLAAGLGASGLGRTDRNVMAWVRSLRQLRREYHGSAERISTSTSFRVGFDLNWFGAVGSGVVAFVGIVVVLPPTAWGLLVLPALDVAASFGWRIPISRKLKQLRSVHPTVVVRQATFDDVGGIVELDAAMYGATTGAVTDDPRAMFASRIQNSHGWFWVAEADGRIEGILAAQPTMYSPDEFVSWERSTANGTFEGTYDEGSAIMYVGALTVSKAGSMLDATDKLLVVGVKAAIRLGKELAYFSARMPLYHRYADQMSPDEYYEATITVDGNKVPLDPQLRLYDALGMRRVRLVENGFAADWESGGYAVLYTFSVPFYGWPGRAIWSWLFGIVADRPRMFALFARYA